MHYFKELKVWQKSMDLAVDVYGLMAFMPKEEMYALTSQIKKCAVSIPSNIAEGAGRSTDKDFARFIDISNGSTNEIETQLILANRLQFLSLEQVNSVFPAINSIKNMNFKLLKKLGR